MEDERTYAYGQTDGIKGRRVFPRKAAPCRRPPAALPETDSDVVVVGHEAYDDGITTVSRVERRLGKEPKKDLPTEKPNI